ncbi:Sugar transport protein, partial [Actinidia chinensis var. chinensis]
MAVGGFAVDGNVGAFSGRITASVVITCIVAASGGLIFGYDIGISGGVTTMRPFLKKFFPSVLRKAAQAKTNIYCVYDSQALTAFTSSLYIAGLASSLVASRLTAALGRRNIMVLGGCTFFAGAAINGGAENLFMLILGRILLGFGVGFTNQATPVYLSEMAPHKWRGAFNTGFQFFIGIGVVTANCLNYGAARLSWGWRLSLGLAAVPATVMTIGALLISDTPSSLVERNKLDEARKALARVRGNDADIEPELADLVKSSEVAKAANREPFVTIFERQYRPHLVMSFAIPFFQQVTGINIIAFYAPVLFQSVGFGSDSALIAAIILGLVNLGSILVSTAMVDRFGRRFLFLQGGTQMFVCQVALAGVLAAATGVSGTKQISKGLSILVLVLMCLYAAGFGWSWGPLSWLIPSEIFPMKIRTMGQSISVAVN